ncbi:MAG: L-glutamate gamma-semialdehyde dehydrogenase [Phycisphaerae bacterium]|nr:L-glutamate gamma-semialdehyde dehydrogenase [Phycisphaerae bacterium]MCZ2398781.1 L-glutamate gamma-semialdehyde dehydrogenase [Phycisphaerae bacterium]NUQ49268.1 L-glutamate gamma-semialdehyde dehydrogenase [Phycisphaerae bacterium]
MLTPYRPEPYVNFAEPEPRQKMLAALKDVRSRLGRTYPLRLGDKRIETAKTIDSLMPGHYATVVGKVGKASREQAQQAMDAAQAAFRTWSRVEPETRARILFKAAAIMRRRVYELAAWMCFEESKSWIEAYADACEAIDFLDFYGREMIRLGGPQPVTPFPGEDNELRYIPLGVGVVIPPWNFPLAICAGMTSAAVVTGNTVILKPASTSPVIAAIMCEIFEQAGLPPGVINFCPGSGGEIGDFLVEHPQTRFVAFTGSMEVGLRIYEKCGKVAPGQIWLKRSIMEMGGKDCIVVDETADLDAAAEGVVVSAFGFQGQKCSACSRLIAHQDIYDKLLERVVDRAKKLTIGDTTSEENYYMGAVIDEAAFKSITGYIDIGRKEGRLVLGEGAGGGQAAPKGGYFIPPTIIADVDRKARISCEEIFGPVLAVMKARDFDDGLDIANGTIYGLTGALYSNDRFRLERARHEFHVGNLYLNRKCTGALVDVQPFGGFNMSGTDSKAGGRDYLLLFMQGKSITERL